jgi:hypothetical protein
VLCGHGGLPFIRFRFSNLWYRVRQANPDHTRLINQVRHYKTGIMFLFYSSKNAAITTMLAPGFVVITGMLSKLSAKSSK